MIVCLHVCIMYTSSCTVNFSKAEDVMVTGLVHTVLTSLILRSLESKF